MKKVALVGFSKRSNKAAYSLPDDTELWTLNTGHTHGFPRIDRLFDMHPWEIINDPAHLSPKNRGLHLAYLTSKHPHPIYMLDAYPQVPSAIRYPLPAAKMLAGPHRGFTSTFCYMIALALLENYTWIELYGFDMDGGTEYAYQRDEALKWIGFAEGMGAKVVLDPDSGLNTKPILYGYEGIPMVNRITIETHIKQYKREEEKAVNALQNWRGVHQERIRSSQSRRLIEEARQMCEGFDRQAAMNEGAIKALQFLLDTCDLKEIDAFTLGNSPQLEPEGAAQ